MIVLFTVLAAVTILLVYEFFALFTGKPLVTTIIRDAYRAAPGPFMVVAFLMGVLFGHFFWV